MSNYKLFVSECYPGLTGIECNLKCNYPLYGKDCQQLCNCSISECDFAFGCFSGKKLNH